MNLENKKESELLLLPKGWACTKLGDVVEFQYGKGLTEAKRDSKGSVPVYGSNGIVGFHLSPLVDKPSLIVGRKGAVGEVHLSKVSCWPIDTTYYVLPPEGLDISFLFYLLKTLRLNTLDKSTAIPSLNRNDAYALNIALPPLAEQQRIVAKIEELFTKLDAGVEALKKVKAQLKRYRQAVLKCAFEGRLTEEWREAHKEELEPASVLLERIRKEMLFKKGKGRNNPPIPPLAKEGKGGFDDLPELPEDWVWTTIGDISDSIHYGYTASAIEEKVGPKLLRITDIQNNSVNWDTVPYCKIDKSEKQKYLLKDADLVFARTGATVGKSFLIVGNIPESVFASYLIRIILNDSINKKFIYNFFQSTNYWSQINKGKLGIGQPNVNAQTLSQITIPLPPFPEQNKIVEEIERRFSVADEVDKIVDQNRKQAERLRQSILKKAFEGRLVPQDPTDEPAEKLLERIKQEKKKTVG